MKYKFTTSDLHWSFRSDLILLKYSIRSCAVTSTVRFMRLGEVGFISWIGFDSSLPVSLVNVLLILIYLFANEKYIRSATLSRILHYAGYKPSQVFSMTSGFILLTKYSNMDFNPILPFIKSKILSHSNFKRHMQIIYVHLQKYCL